MDDEARVAQPGIPVVPIRISADHLGERRDRCGQHGARLLIGQPLQHANAEGDLVGEHTLRPLVELGPRAPAQTGVLERRPCVDRCRGSLGRGDRAREVAPFAGPKRERAADAGTLIVEALGPHERQRHRGALRLDDEAVSLERGCDKPVGAPWLESMLDLHDPFDTP